MKANLDQLETHPAPLPLYHQILLGVDSSDHANRGIEDGIALANLSQANITAAHVYAAQMHDMRFRQMEGGLPEKYREEQELERQRDVHDDLITRGLSIIADSYMDPVSRVCRENGLKFKRCALEGKNYRQLTEEANSGKYDLLVMGALGLGAVADTTLGTVCERVVRRSNIDTLVIKTPSQSIANGPIVVAIDGSSRSYGALLTALSLAQEWQVPVHVISAFDPYYHYVAFNRIAQGLSEEAGKIFKFKQQERLHEEIIDSGLAKIYDGHLQIAQQMADDYSIPIVTKLLDGKPYDVIARYLADVKPSLLVLGKLGIHADEELDIGGNAENLLRNAECAVLLSQQHFTPQIERVADVSIAWTIEAEQRLKRAPSFVQNMARMAILRFAQERGHTVITESIVEQATAALMPAQAEQAMSEIVAAHDAGDLTPADELKSMPWSESAQEKLDTISDQSLRDNLRLRAEKKALSDHAQSVELSHLVDFMDSKVAVEALHWEAAALARLARVPEGFMRDACKQRIETYARENNVNTINLDIAESGLEQARAVMAEQQAQNPKSTESSSAPKSKCPFAQAVPPQTVEEETPSLEWSEQAMQRLNQVPAGYCRTLTKRSVETLAQQNDLHQIDIEFVETILDVFSKGSQSVDTSMPWTADASARIERAPDAVRGMLIKEIEDWARREQLSEVNERAVRCIKREWQTRGVFHLDPDDPRGNT